MAANEHEAEARIRRTQATASLISPIAASLRNLSKGQTEELVLFLKDLHNPPDPHGDDGRVWNEFEPKLEALRNSPEQVRLQKLASRAIWWAIGCGIGAGVFAILALESVLVSFPWLVSILLSLAVIALLWKALLCGLRALLLSKEQDRKYLLSSLRAARCVNELNHAGLFAYADDTANPQSKYYNEKKAKEVIAGLTQQMRDSIYRNAYEGNLGDYLEHDLAQGSKD
jgi:hypothetical protein